MTLNNAKIVKCPYCGAKKGLMSLGSGNTIGAQYWSDLKVTAPMLPKISPIQKCADCGKYYLEYKQDASEGEKYSFEDGKLSYWEWKEAYGQLCDEGIDEEDLLNVRGWLVQSYNDFFHREETKNTSSKDEYLFIKGVINELIKTIDWSETLDPLFPGGASFGDPAQEKFVLSSKLSPVLKAELYREAGEFQKCKELLLSFQGKSINTFDAQLCYGIKEQVEKGESAVFKFYDDREEEEKTRREREAQKGFKQCPNGHYYQGDHCPYCSTGEKSRKTMPNNVVKVCANHHAYNTKLSKCPICGSSVVIDKYNWGQDTIDYCVIRIDNPIQIIIKDKKFSNISQIIVHLSRGNRYGYSFSDGCSGLHNNVNIEPDEEIKIGETTIKGKELMRMCDVILDNGLSFDVWNNEDQTCLEKQESEFNLKGCHNLHAYDSELNTCPICGSSVIIDGFRYNSANTMYSVFIHLINPVKVKSGEKELPECNYIRIEMPAGWLFKYFYSFSSSDDWENSDDIIIEPDREILFGSVAMVGRDFIRLCDLVLENKLSYKTEEISPDDLIQLHELLKKVTKGQEEINQSDQDSSLINDVEEDCVIDETDKVIKTITIGRSSDDDVVIDDPLVTRCHCVIEKVQSGKYRIENFGENGTYVNGKKIVGKVILQQYDIVRIGNTSLLNPDLYMSKNEQNVAGQDDRDIEGNNTCCEPESKNDTFIESKKSREFKKCPNGHYYQGDHCPYCQIEYLGNSQYRIVDLESATGTFVNGKRVEGSCPLNPFDEISVGGIRVPWMHHFASKDAGKGMTLSGIVLPPDDWNE